MLILAYFLKAVAGVLGLLINLLLLLVIARAVISWVNPDPYNPIVRFLNDSTDPILRPIRRIIPPIGPGIDLSPILLMILLFFLNTFLVGLLTEYAFKLGASAGAIGRF